MTPSLLLLDEPFSNVDELTREQLYELLCTLVASNGVTMLLVTHSMSEAVYLADRVLVLGGSPATIVREHRVTLPRPRTAAMRSEQEFLTEVDAVRQSLAERST